MSASMRFGYNAAVPEGTEVAWGGRLIVTQDGHVDLPPDRVGCMGDEASLDTFYDLLDERYPKEQMFSDISLRLIRGEINTRKLDQVVLYDDDQVTMVGSALNSGGYFYVAAWPKSGSSR